MGSDGITLLPVDLSEQQQYFSCLEMSSDYTLTSISSSTICQNDFSSHYIFEVRCFLNVLTLFSWTLNSLVRIAWHMYMCISLEF